MVAGKTMTPITRFALMAVALLAVVLVPIARTSRPAAAEGSASLSSSEAASTPNFSSAGTPITFTYQLDNTGSVALTVGASSTVAGSAACPTEPLAPGQQETCEASYTTTQGDVDAGGITDDATATGTPAVGSAVTADTDVTVTAEQVSSIGITKSADVTSYEDPGTQIDYSYDVVDTGDDSLTSVGVTDPMPGLSAVTCPDSSLAPINDGTSSETCTATYTTSQADVDAGSLTNTGTAAGTSSSDGPVSAQSTLTVNAVWNPSLVVTSDQETSTDNGSYAIVGTWLSYSYTVENTGNVTLNTPSISGTVDYNEPATTPVSATCAPSSIGPGQSASCSASDAYQTTLVDEGTVSPADPASGMAAVSEESSPSALEPNGNPVPSGDESGGISTAQGPYELAPLLSAAGCRNIAADGGTPLNSVDETHCINGVIADLNTGATADDFGRNSHGSPCYSLTCNTEATPVVWDLGNGSGAWTNPDGIDPQGGGYCSTSNSYEVDLGLKIHGPQWLTIEDGCLYNDGTNNIGNQTPILEIDCYDCIDPDTLEDAPAYDTVQDISMDGAYPIGAGDWNPYMDGLETEGCGWCTFDNDSATNVFGDGFHFTGALNSAAGIVSNTKDSVGNYLYADNAGRDELCPIGVNKDTFSNVLLGPDVGYSTMDMEVDSLNLPVNTITFDNLTTYGFVEDSGANGPIVINGWTMEQGGAAPYPVYVYKGGTGSDTAYTLNGYLPQYGGAQSLLRCHYQGNESCIDVTGGSQGVDVNDTTFTINGAGTRADAQPLWFVGSNSSGVELTDDCITDNGDWYEVRAANASVTQTYTEGFSCPTGTSEIQAAGASSEVYQATS